jgi:hypothetical protein
MKHLKDKFNIFEIFLLLAAILGIFLRTFYGDAMKNQKELQILLRFV